MQVQSRYWEYLKRRIPEILILTFLWFGIGYLMYGSLIPYAFTKEERVEYEKLKSFLDNPQTYKVYPLNYITQVRERLDAIEDKYALYRAFPFVNLRAFIVAFISFSIPAIAFILLSRYFLTKSRSFFFRIAQKEPPLKLGKPYRLLFFKDKGGILSLTEKEFVDIVFGGNLLPYAQIMAFFNGEIIETDKIKFPAKEINKRIEEYTNNLVKWGYATFKLLPQDEKLFRACVYLSLLHHTASLYGNIPVSFLSPFITNPVVNDFKSFYYYGKLPVKEGKTRDFLTIFHTYPVDILDELKREFTPLSFEKDDAYLFNEDFFRNPLSDYELEQEAKQQLEEEVLKEEKEVLSRWQKLKQSVGRKGKFFLSRFLPF